MKKIVYTILVFFLLTGCQKGEEVTVFEELSDVFLMSGFNGVSIFRNNENLVIQQSKIKVPFGEATYRFEDANGNVLVEQSINFDSPFDTLSFLNEGENSLLLPSISDVAIDATRLKFDVANLTSFGDGGAINILVYKIDAYSLEVLGEGELITNVSSSLSNEYQALDLGGIASELNSTDRYSLLLYMLDSNREPILRDGYPIVFLQSLLWTSGEIHKVYQLILRDNVESELGMILGIGVYPEGTYFYNLFSQQSK